MRWQSAGCHVENWKLRKNIERTRLSVRLVRAGWLSKTINELVCPNFMPCLPSKSPIKQTSCNNSFVSLPDFINLYLPPFFLWDLVSNFIQERLGSRTVDDGKCSAEARLHNGWGGLRPHRHFPRTLKTTKKWEMRMGAEKILAFRLWKSGNLGRLIQDQNWRL